MVDSYEPIHGVLLCEGEDIDPSLYDTRGDGGDERDVLSPEQLEAVQRLHLSDAAVDHEKDSIELLAHCCIERNVPFLGICRGSQVLNVACGGSLYQDIGHELHLQADAAVCHMDYANYDGHRDPVRVLPGTPLHDWFAESLLDDDQLMVNNFHHQGGCSPDPAALVAASLGDAGRELAGSRGTGGCLARRWRAGARRIPRRRRLPR